MPLGLPSVSTATASTFALPFGVSSAQTATDPCAPGTRSAHSTWSLVRCTSVAALRGVPSGASPTMLSDSPRSSSALHATSHPPFLPPAGRTKSAVASRGTGVTTLGSESGAPSTPVGTTSSSCPPPIFAASIHATSPPSAARAVNGPMALRAISPTR